MAAADTEKEQKEQSQETRRGADGGNIFLTCLRIRFEERGSWSKALEDPPLQAISRDSDTVEGVVSAGVPSQAAEAGGSPKSACTPSHAKKDKSPTFRRGLTVPVRLDDESSSSNSSPSPRKLRSKLCHLAFGYASETLLLQQSSVISSGFWGRALGGNDVAGKHPQAPSEFPCGGVAVTAKPLRPLRGQASRPTRGLPSARAAYYFELEVLETDPETTNALSLGYCFFAGKKPQEPLPRTATELPGAFVLGGELPKAHFGGTEIGSSLEWRPLIHVHEGSRIGALLEVRDLVSGLRELPVLRVSIFQDSTLRTEASISPSALSSLTQEEQASVLAAAAGQRPHALAEVRGNIRSLRLCTEVNEPPLLR